MSFDAEIGINFGFVYVVLENREAVEGAIREVDGTALFSQKVVMGPAKVLSEEKISKHPDLRRGWWASDSNHHHAKTLGVRQEPPKDIFRPRREGRTLTMLDHGLGLPPPGIYSLLHKYNVECISKQVKYQDARNKTEKSLHNIPFATREEAAQALHGLDGSIWKGIKIQLHKWQLSR